MQPNSSAVAQIPAASDLQQQVSTNQKLLAHRHRQTKQHPQRQIRRAERLRGLPGGLCLWMTQNERPDQQSDHQLQHPANQIDQEAPGHFGCNPPRREPAEDPCQELATGIQSRNRRSGQQVFHQHVGGVRQCARRRGPRQLPAQHPQPRPKPQHHQHEDCVLPGCNRLRPGAHFGGCLHFQSVRHDCIVRPVWPLLARPPGSALTFSASPAAPIQFTTIGGKHGEYG